MDSRSASVSSNIMARALRAPHRPPTISHRPNRKMYEARLLLTPSPPPPTQLTSEQMMRTCRHEPSVHQVHIEARPLACACEASHNPPSTSSPHSAAFKIFPVRPMFFPPPPPTWHSIMRYMPAPLSLPDRHVNTCLSIRRSQTFRPIPFSLCSISASELTTAIPSPPSLHPPRP